MKLIWSNVTNFQNEFQLLKTELEMLVDCVAEIFI